MFLYHFSTQNILLSAYFQIDLYLYSLFLWFANTLVSVYHYYNKWLSLWFAQDSKALEVSNSFQTDGCHRPHYSSDLFRSKFLPFVNFLAYFMLSDMFCLSDFLTYISISKK